MQNGIDGHSSDASDSKFIIQAKKVADTPGFPYTGREGQVACSIGSRVYIFGGVEQGHGEEPKETNELMVFDLATSQWSKPEVSGTIPPPRSAASLVAVGTKMYLFGGLSHMSGWFDDLFVFDTATNYWSLLETEGPCPRARDKLQAVAIDSNIYYFGGFGPKSDEAEAIDLEGGSDEDDDEFEDIPEAQDQDGAEFGWFNDLYILDTVNFKWSQPMQMNLGVPTQRAAHGMCAINRHLVIFGGRDIEDRQNDLHIFNVGPIPSTSVDIKQTAVTVSPPSLGTSTSEGSIGHNTFPPDSLHDTRKWLTELKISGQVPGERSFHTLTTVENKAVLFGGRGRNNQHFDQIDVFDFDQKSWQRASIEGDKPSGRGQHCTVLVGDSLFLFGGSGNFSLETMQCQTFYTDAFLIDTNCLKDQGKPNGVSNAAGDS